MHPTDRMMNFDFTGVKPPKWLLISSFNFLTKHVLYLELLVIPPPFKRFHEVIPYFWSVDSAHTGSMQVYFAASLNKVCNNDLVVACLTCVTEHP